MNTTLVLVLIVVIICIWYYCFVRAKGASILNYLFPPCQEKKINIVVPAVAEEFRDDISSHIKYSEGNLKSLLH
jgi:hypothetical protein